LFFLSFLFEISFWYVCHSCLMSCSSRESSLFHSLAHIPFLLFPQGDRIPNVFLFPVLLKF
jgi:hypothetical protein